MNSIVEACRSHAAGEPITADRYVALPAVIKADFALIVAGDCLTARDIHDGDIIAIDTKVNAALHDIVICYRKSIKTYLPIVKEYIGQVDGKYLVSERRCNNQNRQYSVNEILGVVVACCAADGALRWMK